MPGQETNRGHILTIPHTIRARLGITIGILAWVLSPGLSRGVGVRLDPGFAPELDPQLQAVRILPTRNQSVLVVARFSGLGPQGNLILRLLENGQMDPSFLVYSNDAAAFSVLATNASGQIYAGGSWTGASWVTGGFLVRLGSDGVVDESFQPKFLGTGAVETLAVEPSGAVLAGGAFTNVNGIACSGLVRIGPDGRVDPDYRPRVEPDYPGYTTTVHAVALEPGGSLVVSAEVWQGSPLSVHQITRFLQDGRHDPTFVSAPGPDYPARVLRLQADGRILVGGQFLSMRGKPRLRLARLNTDGTLDSGFDPVAGVSRDEQGFVPSGCEVSDIALDDSQRVVVFGLFWYVSGVARPGVARLLPNGSIDPEFDAGYAARFPGGSVLIYNGGIDLAGRVIVAGETSGFEASFFQGLRRYLPGNPDAGGAIEFAGGALHVSEHVGQARVRLRRVNGLQGAASVRVEMFDGTAVSGSDYTGRTVDVPFADGESEREISVPILQDSVPEDGSPCGGCLDPATDQRFQGESFFLHLVGVTGAARLGSQVWQPVEIQDDDVGFAFVDKDVWVNEVELRARIEIRRVGDLTGTNHVSYRTRNGTATSGLDYLPASDTVTFLPGEATHEFEVTILPDRVDESDETLTVELASPSAPSMLVSPSVATVTIRDVPNTHVTPFAGGVDVSFVAKGVGLGAVAGILEQADGNLLVSGLISAPWINATRLLRLHPDGSLDPTFHEPDPGLWKDSAGAVALQSDGRILVAGHRLMRLNPDGTPDESFPPLEIRGGDPMCLLIQPDGQILLGGSFTRVGAADRPWVARITPSGTLDDTFAVSTSLVAEGVSQASVRCLAIQADGRILIGGGFTTDGVRARGVARLTPTGGLDPSFIQDPGFSGDVHVVRLDDSGRVVAGGYGFPSPLFSLARFNADGTLDTSFHPPVDPTTDLVSSIAIHEDGRMVIGGSGWGWNGPSTATMSSIWQILPDGALDPGFDPGSGPSGPVSALLIDSKGSVLVGGDFGSVDGMVVRNLVRVRGRDPAPFRPLLLSMPQPAALKEGADVTFSVEAWGFPLPSFQWYRDGEPIPGATASNLALVGVSPRLAGGYAVVVANSVGSVTSAPAILNIQPAPTGPGSLDVGFRVDMMATEEGPVLREAVTALAVDAHDRLLVGGQGAKLNLILSELERFNADGTRDASFSGGAGFPAQVEALVLQPDGGIVVAGDYGSVVRLRENGDPDPAFQTGGYFNGRVRTLALYPDGKVLAGGEFSSLGFVDRRWICRLNSDGSLDTTFEPPANPAASYQDGISALAIQTNHQVLIGGRLSSVFGLARRALARLNADGSLDAGYEPRLEGIVEVRDLVLQADGRLIVAGVSDASGPVAFPGLVRLNPDGTPDPTFDASRVTPAFVQFDRVTVLNNGKLLVLGASTQTFGTLSYHCMRLLPDGTPDGTFTTGSGPSSLVRHLAVQSDGGVVLGGLFTSVDERPRAGVARLVSDPAAAGGQIEFTEGLVELSEDVSAERSITVRRTGEGSGLVTVDYGIVAGSASPGLDLRSVGGTLRFEPNGPREMVIRLSALDDLLPEGDETAQLWLANAIGGGAIGPQGAVKILIHDDDRMVGFTTNHMAGDEGGGVVVSVRRYGSLTGTERVRLRSVEESARGGVDFTPLDTELVFPPGTTERSVAIRFLGDDWGAPDRTFRLVLEAPQGGLMLGEFSEMGITIRDDDRPGTLDRSFKLSGVPLAIAMPYNIHFDAVRVLKDGRLVVAGGAFGSLGGHGIVLRLNPDGAMDATFGPISGQPWQTADSEIAAIEVMPGDERIVASGHLWQRGCATCLGGARFDVDGTRDPGFIADPDLSGYAVSIARSPLEDGALFVAGWFRHPGLVALDDFRTRAIVRLRGDGSVDGDFRAPWGNASAMAPLPNGAVYLAGTDSSGGILAPSPVFYRLGADGSVDPGFDFAKDFHGESGFMRISVIAPQPDGRVLIGTSFSLASVSSWPFLMRVNSDGSLDASFQLDPGLGNASSSPLVTAVRVQPDGRILVAGRLSVPGHSAPVGLIRLHASGALDLGFDPVELRGRFTLSDSSIRDIALLEDGSIIVAGMFYALNGTEHRGIARVHGGRALSIQSVALNEAGNATLRWWAPKDGVYGLESSGDLRSWTDVETGSFSSGTAEWIDTSTPAGPARYYRIHPVR